MHIPRASLIPPILLLSVLPLEGQLRSAADGRVAMGHHHLTATDTMAQRRFWVDGLGASQAMLGSSPVFKLPDLLVLVRPGDPAGGMEGTTVPEFSLRVRNLGEVLGRLEPIGYLSTATIASRAGAQRREALVQGPGGIRVVLEEQPDLDAPVANGSITLAGPDPAAMRDWYVKTFGASPREGAEPSADLAGVRLRFVLSTGAAMGSQGRALDHIGFEVRELETFARNLEERGVTLDRPYRHIPALPLGLVFLTDPWGTYIELTEGLDRL